MLFLVSGTLWCHRNNQADGGDLVVTIGSGEHHRQRSTALIDEEVDLRSEFAPVGGVLAHFLASQRSRGVLGVYSLPLPADPAALAGIVLDHPPPELLEYARPSRSEEHTSELQSRQYLVCRLLLEKKKKI